MQRTEPVYKCKNVTVRNDPDGRSRLNVNIFTGDIIVTDFGDIPTLGNIQTTSLPVAYDKWKNSKAAKEISCHVRGFPFLGSNILVKNGYYQNEDFTIKKEKITKL